MWQGQEEEAPVPADAQHVVHRHIERTTRAQVHAQGSRSGVQGQEARLRRSVPGRRHDTACAELRGQDAGYDDLVPHSRQMAGTDIGRVVCVRSLVYRCCCLLLLLLLLLWLTRPCLFVCLFVCFCVCLCTGAKSESCQETAHPAAAECELGESIAGNVFTSFG
jgi:hypothetical protein